MQKSLGMDCDRDCRTAASFPPSESAREVQLIVLERIQCIHGTKMDMISPGEMNE